MGSSASYSISESILAAFEISSAAFRWMDAPEIRGGEERVKALAEKLKAAGLAKDYDGEGEKPVW